MMQHKRNERLLRILLKLSLAVNFFAMLAFVVLQQKLENIPEDIPSPKDIVAVDIDPPSRIILEPIPVEFDNRSTFPTWEQFRSFGLMELQNFLEEIGMPSWAIDNLLVAKVNMMFKDEVALFAETFSPNRLLSHRLYDQNMQFATGYQKLELARREELSKILGIPPEYVPGPNGFFFDLETVARSAMLIGDIEPNHIISFINLENNFKSDLDYLTNINLNLETPGYISEKKSLENKFHLNAKELLGNTYDEYTAAVTYLKLFDATSPERFFGSNVSEAELYRIMLAYAKGSSSDALHSNIKTILGKERFEIYLLLKDPIFGRYSGLSLGDAPTVEQLDKLSEIKALYETELENSVGDDTSNIVSLVKHSIVEVLGDKLYEHFINSKYSWLK